MIDEKTILPRYFDILEKNKTVQYLKSKYAPVSFDIAESTEKLWEKHDASLNNQKTSTTEPPQTLLDLKIELANRMFQQCIFCERRCRIDRRNTSGDCGVKGSRIASEFHHRGEEHVLVPSYTIFFSGCTFHCVFCQNWDISQQICGLTVDPNTLSTLITTRKKEGAKNVNWVGGDPTSNLFYILKVLKECKENISQIWNSNMYCTEETMKLLNGVIDLYLTDFKYGNNSCTKRLSKVENYTAIVKRNHKIASNQGDVIIRHLVMPNHRKCCSEPILKWISKNLPNTAVNVMAQYRPEYDAHEFEDIARPLSREEYLQVKTFAEKQNIYVL